MLKTALVEDVVEFLARTPPFDSLDTATLRVLAGTVRVDFYPKDTAILAQGGPPSEHLHIVAKGGAKVFMYAGDGGEVFVDRRSAGDAIGFLSLYSKDRSRINVVALEDTTCYLIPREPFMALFDAHPEVREHFHRSVLAKYMDRAFADMRSRSLLSGGGERLLFSTPIGQVAAREVVTAAPDVSIRAAAELMSRRRVSSIVLTEPDGAPAGIVTDRDLREKVTATGRDVSEPVSGIMSGMLPRVDAGESCFKALLVMIRHNVHHVLVTEGGRMRGVASNHDLMMLQSTSPLAVAWGINGQQQVEDLAAIAGKVDALVGLLLREGARAGEITRTITEINDHLVRRVLELVERRRGPAPVPWCWIVLGSAGRRELSSLSEQDHGLVRAESGSEEGERAAREWFTAFEREVREALRRCGVPERGDAGGAATAPWPRSIATWRRRVSKWIGTPTPEAVAQASLLSDFRPLPGSAELADSLRDHLHAAIEGAPAFLGFAANRLVKNGPPIGLFQRLVVEKSGEHKAELNLKLKGTDTIADLARFFALERGVRETPTVERLHALRERHTIVGEHADELAHAFDFLMLLRIRHQQEQLGREASPDNFVNPNALTSHERKTAREAFQLVARMQDLIIERFRASIW